MNTTPPKVSKFTKRILFWLVVATLLYVVSPGVYQMSSVPYLTLVFIIYAFMKPTEEQKEARRTGTPIKKSKIHNSWVVLFLYVVLLYSLIGWYIISEAFNLLEMGASGTEFIGIIAAAYFFYPAILFLIIYSIVFASSDKKRYSKQALRRRQIAIRISCIYWAVTLILPSFIFR